jgi:hypothetical protein
MRFHKESAVALHNRAPTNRSSASKREDDLYFSDREKSLRSRDTSSDSLRILQLQTNWLTLFSVSKRIHPAKIVLDPTFVK